MFDPENNILTIEEGQKIESGKFKDRDDIHQVIFKGKAEIGVGAFDDCTGIRELITPEG